MTYLMKSLEEQKDIAEASKVVVVEKSKEINELQRLIVQQQELIKQNEEHIKETHQKSLQGANDTMNRWNTLQEKYEDNIKALAEVALKNEQLQAKILEMSKLMSESEASWSNKYNEIIKEKETILKQQNEKIVFEREEIKAYYDNRISTLKGQYKKDITELEVKFKALIQKKEGKVKEITEKYEDLLQKAKDLKKLLKLAVKKEAEKDITVEELKDTLQRLSDENAQMREDIGTQCDKYIDENNALKEEMRVLQDQLNKSDESIQEQSNKLKEYTQIIIEKDKLTKILEEQLDDTKQNLESYIMQFEELKEQHNKIGADQRTAIEFHERTIEEANIKLKTKDKMLEDKNEEIGQLRHVIQEMELEISDIRNTKDQYKEYYEGELKKDIDEIERQRERRVKAEEKLEDVGRQLEIAKQKTKKYEEQIETLQEQLDSIQEQIKEKNQVNLINR